MLTLDNFDSTISKEILQRGQQYYLSKSILSLEEVADNQWKAEVEGSEIYTVKVHLKQREITNYSCNCPFEGITCKHAVSVFFALRKDMKKIKEEAKPAKSKKLTIIELLNKISDKELKDFIMEYGNLNKDFAREFELHFAEKDNRIDMRKHYTDIVRKAIKKNSDHGFIDYRSSRALSKEIDNLLHQATAFVQKGKFAEGMLVGQLIITELIEVVGDSDDSSGDLGGSLSEAILLLSDIATSEEVSLPLKTQLYDFLEKETLKKVYYDYGDYGDDIVEVTKTAAMQIGASERFLKLLPQLGNLFSGYSSDFYRKKFLEYQIEVLDKMGRVEEAQSIIAQNMDIAEVREKIVAEALSKNEYNKAKQLIGEGINIAESKNQSISSWEKQLLAIARLENDLTVIRFYVKKFAFEGYFKIDYYRQWKDTYSKQELEVELQKFFDEVYKEAETKSKDKKQLWFEPASFIASRLNPVFIEEKMWDKLLEITKKHLSLRSLDEVYVHLGKQYPTEILDLYMPLLRKFSENLDGRSNYQKLTDYLKKLKKDIAGSEQVIKDFVAELKIKYARKPAMLEELNQVK